MEWFKKHTDAVIVIGAILSSMVWMNSQFNHINKELNELRTELAVIKTVLIMKGIMPIELASSQDGKQS